MSLFTRILLLTSRPPLDLIHITFKISRLCILNFTNQSRTYLNLSKTLRKCHGPQFEKSLKFPSSSSLHTSTEPSELTPSEMKKRMTEIEEYFKNYIDEYYEVEERKKDEKEAPEKG